MGTRIAVAQIDSVLGDIEANLERLGSFVSVAKEQGARAVLFPELFTTGYTLGFDLRKLAEPVPGRTTDYLARLSAESGLYIYGSIVEKRGDKHHNAGVFLSPSEGLIAVYRKVHLFGEEKDILDPGTEPVVVDTDMGPIGLTVCYDLVFPEYIRGLVLMGARFIFNSTFWLRVGAPDEWDWSHRQPTALAVARALENTTGLAMSCRFGSEGDIIGFGHSCVVSPSGRILARLGEGEGVTSAEIPMDRVADFRKLATYFEDRRVELYRKMLGY
jgi:predicted amidohydrolase